MGLGMSLSGLFNVGHDVGGFSGPRPDPELFVRWVQNGIFHPRFTIHSWNDDGTVNEPWMYPDVTGAIRDALRLRYRFLPYLYTLMWQAHHGNEPMLRPTFLDHPGDPKAWLETDDFMLGQDLLVANIVHEGATERVVRLPENGTGWWDFHAQTWHAPGETVSVSAEITSIPLFVRAGAVLPLSVGANRADPGAEQERELAVFPCRGAARTRSIMYDDDGISRNATYGLVTFDLKSDDADIMLDGAQEGLPGIESVRIRLPKTETRRFHFNGATIQSGGTATLI